MIVQLPAQIILYDTEYTTWQGAPERNWSGQNEHRELVHIGAVKVDTLSLNELDAFEIYIKPRINPILSDFFIEFTGIQQETVDRLGVSFPEAWQRFNVWRSSLPSFAFGRDDLVIDENCRLNNVPVDLNKPFFNICEYFEQKGISTREYHSSTIVRAFGVEPRLDGHNALNDARLILDALRLSQTRNA